MTDEAVEALVRRYRDIGAVIAEMQSEQADIKGQIDQMVEVGWKATVDGVAVHKREANRQFDLVTAIGYLSDEAKERCRVTRYDDKAVRAAVEESGDIDACMLVRPDAAAIVKL